MKKRIFALLLIAIVLLTMLTGCHGAYERNEFDVPEAFDTSRNYEISFWAKNDTNNVQIGVYEQAVKDFEALYPNVKVSLRLFTNYQDIYADVLKNIGANTLPNVCITYPDHIATYMTGNNCVVPLGGLIADEKYGLGGSELLFDGPTKEEIVPKFLEEGVIGDTQYAIPFMRSTEGCYINKTYVEKLGYTLPETLTWDFVWEVSNAAMKKNPDGTFAINGQDVMIPFIYKSTDNMMIQMLRQLNAGYSTAGGTIEIFNDSTKEVLKDIAENAKTGAFNTFKAVGYPGNYLNLGQCIFAVDSTAGATWIGPDAPLVDIPEDEIADVEIVVKEIPQYHPEKPTMISQGPSVCVFNQDDPQEVLASWLFAQFLLTNKVQISYAQTEGYAPVTTKAQQSEEYQDYLSRAGEDNDLHYKLKLDATKLLLDNVSNTFVTPVFNGSTSLRNAAGQLIEEARKSGRRNETLDDTYFDELFTEMTALYRLNQVRSKDVGTLPETAIWLLAALGGTWVVLGTVIISKKIKRKR